jgi:hypothetical protein
MTMKLERTSALTPLRAVCRRGRKPALSPEERVGIITALETSQSPLPSPIRCRLQTRHTTTRHIYTAQNAANDSPSPGGEGRGEGERKRSFR